MFEYLYHLLSKLFFFFFRSPVPPWCVRMAPVSIFQTCWICHCYTKWLPHWVRCPCQIKLHDLMLVYLRFHTEDGHRSVVSLWVLLFKRLTIGTTFNLMPNLVRPPCTCQTHVFSLLIQSVFLIGQESGSPRPANTQRIPLMLFIHPVLYYWCWKPVNSHWHPEGTEGHQGLC